MAITVGLGMLLVSASGCGWLTPNRSTRLTLPDGVQMENPLFVGLTDTEFIWTQVVDSIDDHFSIEREERMRQVGDVVTEGRLYTFPKIGSTYFEPWRSDSTAGFEKLHSTLQSVRRQAFVRVTPSQGGFLLEVIVSKELEDLYQPEFSSIGGSVRRHDGSVERASGGVRNPAVSLGWIPQGRDLELEQRLLLDLQARLAVSNAPF
jgi:hypothetical protein